MKTRLAALAVVPVLLVALAGCGGANTESASGSSSAGGVAASDSAAPRAAQPDRAFSATDALPTDGGGNQPAVDPTVPSRAVISTGHIRLVSDDIAKVRSEVGALLKTYDGFLADESTHTDRHGRQSGTTLTMRVPSGRFDSAMRRLAGFGDLTSARRHAVDVTTDVIDVRQRIKAQEIGLHRLEQLMKRSATLPNLLEVEREVTQRQAELDSLKARQAYLSDQTSLSTITLTVRRTPPPAPAVHHTGFLGGLQHGWDALVRVTVALLAGFGAALPFLLVALLLWFPLRRWLRKAPWRLSRNQAGTSTT